MSPEQQIVPPDPSQLERIGSVAAVQAEYRNHGKAGLSTREPRDLLVAVAVGQTHGLIDFLSV